ncbi:hypothetical protein V8B97DRAFT_2062519 [Scleroderma yunnanense]
MAPAFLILHRSEFGLPNYNFCSLSTTNKSHLWLACLNLLALCVFIWQVSIKYFSGPGASVEVHDAVSSARFWFALTVRQSCLLVMSQWMIWALTLLLVLMSTALAGILTGVGIPSLFVGLIAYSATTTALSTAAFGGLVYTLVAIHCSQEVKQKPHQSFTTEDINGLHEGTPVVSNWSFSTYPSIPLVLPLPSPYHPSSSLTCVITEDPDPFCCDVPSCPHLGSQSPHPTMLAWSYPTMQHGRSVIDIHIRLLPLARVSHPATPATLSTAQVLGGYGYTTDSKKGIASLAVNKPGVNVSCMKYVAWLLSVWVTLVHS